MIDHLIRTEIFLANVEATLKVDLSSEEKLKRILLLAKEFTNEK